MIGIHGPSTSAQTSGCIYFTGSIASGQTIVQRLDVLNNPTFCSRITQVTSMCTELVGSESLEIFLSIDGVDYADTGDSLNSGTGGQIFTTYTSVRFIKLVASALAAPRNFSIQAG